MCVNEQCVNEQLGWTERYGAARLVMIAGGDLTRVSQVGTVLGSLSNGVPLLSVETEACRSIVWLLQSRASHRRLLSVSSRPGAWDRGEAASLGSRTVAQSIIDDARAALQTRKEL